jgi:IS30 family transposase
MLGIALRDPAAQERVVPGNREGDFIKGAGNRSAVGVLVYRKSRLVLLAKMDDCSAASPPLAGYVAKLKSVPHELRLSLTYDQGKGKGMACHAELTSQTGMPVYFCDPHSPWQRGTCENTNGLLRQFLPKGTDLSVHTQEDLDYVAAALNGRPRQTLDWNCPLYFFEDMLTHDSSSSSTVTT